MSFFTVRVGMAGLGDQLNQLSYLFAIGKALSYTYVHTPFVCPRSSSVSLYSRLKRRLSHYIHCLNNDDRVVKFIGLDRHDLNIDDTYFHGYQTVDVNLEYVLSGNTNPTISQIKQYIETLVSFRQNVLYSFNWTPQLYDMIPELDHLISNLTESGENIGFDFAERYWKARASDPVALPFDDNKVTIAIHIRRGDTACIRLNGRLIATLGTVRFIDSIREASDQWMEQIDTYEYYDCLTALFNRYGEDTFSVVVLSDGYDRTFKLIRHKSNLYNLHLSSDELIQLNKLKHNYEKEEMQIFKQHLNVSTIIGESERNLFHSIHAIACADIVIYGSRSFAKRMQDFRKPKHTSIMINVREYNESTLDLVQKIVDQKAGQ